MVIFLNILAVLKPNHSLIGHFLTIWTMYQQPGIRIPIVNAINFFQAKQPTSPNTVWLSATCNTCHNLATFSSDSTLAPGRCGTPPDSSLNSHLHTTALNRHQQRRQKTARHCRHYLWRHSPSRNRKMIPGTSATCGWQEAKTTLIPWRRSWSSWTVKPRCRCTHCHSKIGMMGVNCTKRCIRGWLLAHWDLIIRFLEIPKPVLIIRYKSYFNLLITKIDAVGSE